MNQDFDAVIQALTKFRNNVRGILSGVLITLNHFPQSAENDEKLQRVVCVPDHIGFFCGSALHSPRW